jgi:RNA polymerase-binding transcription factor DksA
MTTEPTLSLTDRRALREALVAEIDALDGPTQSHSSEAEHHLATLRALLVRAEEGTLGVCETCHGFIGVERTIALPDVRRCMTCATSHRAL